MSGASTARTLAGRRVLVTAGPTWVPIDDVRFIGNRSSGRTGLLIARVASRSGAAVTLLYGPGLYRPAPEDRAAMTILDYQTFDDLQGLLRVEVVPGAYDAVVHVAAVSDYRPEREERGKISSEEETRVLVLRRTPKLVKQIRDADPNLLLVSFKLEAGLDREGLLQSARDSGRRAGAQIVVANDLTGLGGDRHHAILLEGGEPVAEVQTSVELADRLVELIALRLCGRQEPNRS